MSRSYKHTPIIKDWNHKNYGKIAANRQFRRKYNNAKMLLDEDFDLLNNKQYKKDFERYDIHDNIYYQSKDLARKEYEFYCKPCAYWFSSRFKKCTHEYCQAQADAFKKEYPTFEDYIAKSWGKSFRRK